MSMRTDHGIAHIATIDGSVADRRATAAGLCPGTPESKICELHPDATRDAEGKWWLVAAMANSHLVLSAFVEGGKVSGFGLHIAPGGD